MKYLVNRETKEHKVATPLAESIIKGYPDFKDDWQLVEADPEGWIPWSGGECPLPEGHAYNFTTNVFPSKNDKNTYSCPEANNWNPSDSGGVTAYRPILSETAEKKEAPAWGGYTEDGQIEPSAFDRLKSALAASESIPGIIAEIDAMLPEGYCVAKREAEKVEQFAEDMSDWRNWREGDLVSHKEGGTFKVVNIEHPGYVGQYGVRIVDSNKETHWIYHRHLSFHSRPAKVAK